MTISSNKSKDLKNAAYNKKLFNKISLFLGLDRLVMPEDFSYTVI